jgi:hypothetical protein
MHVCVSLFFDIYLYFESHSSCTIRERRPGAPGRVVVLIRNKAVDVKNRYTENMRTQRMIKGREDGTNQDYLLSTLEKMSDLKMLKREKAVVRRLMEQEGGGHAGGVGRVHEG